MPLKIRLTRQGRKKRPFYHIVIADSRAPRDGKYIERIGIYNPVTNPATIELNFDRALYWVQQGAQPTDTCRTVLSANGVMYKKHLLEGVKKGAFSEEEAEKRFDAWKKEKDAKLHAIKSKLEKAKEAEAKKKIEAEAKISEEKAKEIAEKKAELAEAEAKAAKKASEEVIEETVEESGEQIAEEPGEETTEEAAVKTEEEAATEVVEEKVEEAEATDAADETVTEKPEEDQQPESEESHEDTEVK